MILVFTLKSLIHLDFIFIYDVNYGSNFCLFLDWLPSCLTPSVIHSMFWGLFLYLLSVPLVCVWMKHQFYLARIILSLCYALLSGVASPLHYFSSSKFSWLVLFLFSHGLWLGFSKGPSKKWTPKPRQVRSSWNMLSAHPALSLIVFFTGYNL